MPPQSDYSLTDQQPNSVFAADLDGNGSLDLVTANMPDDNVSVLLNGTSDVEDEEIVSHLPGTFSLRQNYPNPFNPATVIKYYLKKRCHVELTVYDLLGRKVKTVVDEEKSVGSHSAIWDGTDDSGSKVASGIYFYRLKAGDAVGSKKMILLK